MVGCPSWAALISLGTGPVLGFLAVGCGLPAVGNARPSGVAGRLLPDDERVAGEVPVGADAQRAEGERWSARDSPRLGSEAPAALVGGWLEAACCGAAC